MTSEKLSRFSTMTTYQMFTLWWDEKWVRTLVLLLTPVGIIDATYTVLLFNSLGSGAEFNPIVRIALESQLWGVWFFIDALSFFIFIMMAGSYYLHTRNSLVANRTGLVSGLVSLRVGLAAHNVIRFYAGAPAVLGGMFFTCLTFIIMVSLLDRTSDVTWQGLRQWWRHRTDRFHDYRLIKKAKKSNLGDETQLDEEIEREISAELLKTTETNEPGYSKNWPKRVLYLLGAVTLFIFMPFFLVFLGDWTGVTSFTDIYGPLVFWNELSAPAFLLGFVSICLFTAGIMYLVLRSFDVQDSGAW
ncbi:MAG: hypothetical protein KAU48_12360 [Candidatus Thorarchaeota archaeon]|nr:hypothetical protein [Candidatus Thorarchaeota archaeon]